MSSKKEGEREQSAIILELFFPGIWSVITHPFVGLSQVCEIVKTFITIINRFALFRIIYGIIYMDTFVGIYLILIRFVLSCLVLIQRRRRRR